MTVATIPNRPTGGQVRAIADIIANFDAILDVINGNLDASNLAPGTIPGGGGGTSLPIGAVYISGSGSLPALHLSCDGSAVSRSTYSLLFAAISTNYGSGNGTTTFNLPNLSGRFPMGSGLASSPTPNGATTHALYSKGGEETHLLAGAEVRVAKDPFGAGGDTSPKNGEATAPHNTLPPFLAMKYIIYAGV